MTPTSNGTNGHIAPSESLAKHMNDLYGDRPGAEDAQRAAAQLPAVNPWHQAVTAEADLDAGTGLAPHTRGPAR
jgi:hypothetical protein